MKLKYCIGIALVAFICMHLVTLFNKGSIALAAPNDSEPAHVLLEAQAENDENDNSGDEIAKDDAEGTYTLMLAAEVTDGTLEDTLADLYNDKVSDETNQWIQEAKARYDEGLLLINKAENWIEETF